MDKICDSAIDCGEEKTLLFKKKDFSILECKKCLHRYSRVSDVQRHLSNVYCDDYFFSGKAAGYSNYMDEKDVLYRHGMRYARIVSKYRDPGKILDVGCAAGFILKGFEKYGWASYGIEPNNTVAGYGRSKLNLNITTASLETFDTNEQFDLITMIQVIGHFYDLDKALQSASRLLKPNGLVLVESWNMKSKVARLFGKRWHEYSPPSVVNWFSDKTLAQLFNYYGFKIVTKGRPTKKINIKHAISLIDEKTPNFIFKKKLISSLTRLIGKFNLIYPPLDLKWYIFRKL